MELVALRHGDGEQPKPNQSEIENRKCRPPIAVPIRVGAEKTSVGPSRRPDGVDEAMRCTASVDRVALLKGVPKMRSTAR